MMFCTYWFGLIIQILQPLEGDQFSKCNIIHSMPGSLNSPQSNGNLINTCMKTCSEEKKNIYILIILLLILYHMYLLYALCVVMLLCMHVSIHFFCLFCMPSHFLCMYVYIHTSEETLEIILFTNYFKMERSIAKS